MADSETAPPKLPRLGGCDREQTKSDQQPAGNGGPLQTEDAQSGTQREYCDSAHGTVLVFDGAPDLRVEGVPQAGQDNRSDRTIMIGVARRGRDQASPANPTRGINQARTRLIASVPPGSSNASPAMKRPASTEKTAITPNPAA